MELNLPQSNELTIGKLSMVFSNTTASYKFYWFISFLQLFYKNGNPKIPLKHVLIKMICNAWYPINYYKINFGFSDKLSDNILEIKNILEIPNETDIDDLFIILNNSTNHEINNLIWHFEQMVPYRFLSPWIKGTKREVIMLSQEYENNCLYRIYSDKTFIEINPEWETYLYVNKRIIFDFIYWNLLKYLQLRNPNVPNLASKLIKPITRTSLTKQRNFWNIVFDEYKTIQCIYTGKELTKNEFDIEHFIPWSFVSHDQMWNLIPSDSSINSSKRNKLPSMDKYFNSFVALQYKALKLGYTKNPKMKLLEDYLILDGNINNLLENDFEYFKKKYYDLISPLIQIASNSGFETWQY